MIAARDLLAEQVGIAAEVYSAPSFPLLRRDALEAERWNRLHPKPTRRGCRTSRRVLGPDGGPIVAATDWMKALPDMVSRWLPPYYVSLGTDGFGRSDTREALRSLFEIDPPHIAAAALAELGPVRRDAGRQGRQGDRRPRRRSGQAGPGRPVAITPRRRARTAVPVRGPEPRPPRHATDMPDRGDEARPRPGSPYRRRRSTVDRRPRRSRPEDRERTMSHHDLNDPNRPLDANVDPGAGTDEHGREAVGAGAGALGGAAVGMAVGGPPGAVVGGAIGAVGGAVAGESTEGDDEAGAGAGGLAGGLAGAAVGGAVAGPPGAVVGGAVGAAGGAGAGDKAEEDADGQRADDRVATPRY